MRLPISGFFFLMLLGGIELQPRKLAEGTKAAVGVAIGGMILPLALGIGLGWAVLPETYFRKEHIPHSRNIPVEEENFEQRVEQVVDDKSKKIVVYCANTECDASPKAAKKLEAAGFSDVQDYEAGMKGWKDAGLPVQSAA